MLRNVQEAEWALTQKPLLATSAERFLILDEIKSQYAELPQPLRFAKFLSILLDRVSVPVEKYDLIAGRCVDRELTSAEEQQYQAYLKSPDYPKRRVILDSGHCTYSWEMVAEEGLPGLRRHALKSMERCEKLEQKEFLQAILTIYDAIERYMLRYADAAEERGLSEVAENLREATGEPKHLTAVLQLMWIITLIDCAYITPNPTLTVGRMDQFLYPYYKADIESGRITRERAAEYITDYYCKHNLIMGRGEHQVGDATNSTTFERIYNFDAPQYLMLAGTDAMGQPAVNELTQLMAECIQPSFKNPVIVVRYFPGMNTQFPVLWETLIGKALKSASLMFYNDENMLKGMARLGLPEEDCRKYSHFGCNWPTPGDNAAWMLGGPRADKYDAFESEEEEKRIRIPFMRVNAEHGWAEDFMIVLRELVEQETANQPGNPVTIEDFYARYEARMGEFIDRKLKHQSEDLAVRKRRPSAALTFGDCFYRDSLRTAECFSASAKYHFEIHAFQMFGTVVDCFIAVDQLVMREKKLTLRQLLEAAEADYVGYEYILALCRRAEKYGQDTDLSNYHAKRLAEMSSRLVFEKNRPYMEKEGLFLVPCMQSDTWHLKYGEQYGATVDGRRAHTAFSQNSRPSNGVCTKGLTAMLNSMLSLPAGEILSGALNLDVDPKVYGTEEGQRLFGILLGTYLNRGGLHAQVSAVGLEELLDAQVHPDAHRDLRVRITGYSGVFVDVCKRLQDDIIERFR